MGWLRTNWLDALIFLLVAAIMAAVVLFMTGVNPFAGPQGGQTRPSTVSPPAQQTGPQAQRPLPLSSPQTSEAKPRTLPAPVPQTQTEPEPVVTVLPMPQAPPATPPAVKPVPAPPKVENRRPASAPPETGRSAPAAQLERSTLSADAGGSWRVAVGSFGNRQNAERLAATLRQQGYPVSLEASDSLTRVWVGPYSSPARARSIANTLGQYLPQVARIASSAPTSPLAQSGSSPGSSRFLQVGAFRDAQSAQSVVKTLQQTGYPVLLVEESGLVKVRVGPLDDTAAATAALRARGLEVLEVR